MTLETRLAGNEIELDGIRFKLIEGSAVRSRALSQFAPKVTAGDTDRDSDPLRSTVGFSDLSGGIGLEQMEGANDTNRSWWSTHDTRYPHHMLHLPVAIGPESEAFPNQREIPLPANDAAPIAFMNTYLSELFVGFGTKVYKWNETDGTWGNSVHTLPGIPSHSIVTRLGAAQTLYLIVACGTSGYAYYDGSDWTDVTAQGAQFFAWWDYKLWALESDGQLSRADDPSGTWTEDAWLPLPDDSATAMFTTAGKNNVQAIYVAANDGSLWIHDATNQKFIQSPLQLPIHPDTGIGTTVLRDNIYIPSGLAVYEAQNRAGDFVVSVVGPDADAGLPTERAGRIVQLLATQVSVIAFIEGQSVPGADLPALSSAYGSLPPMVFNSSYRASTILERIRGGWQVLWAGGQDGQPVSDISDQLTVGHVSAAYGKYRLWFGTGNQLWYIDIPRYVLNPLQIPERNYAYRAETITPWFDAGIIGSQKVLLSMLPLTRNIVDGGASFTVEVGYNYNNDSWSEPVDYDESTDLDSILYAPRFDDDTDRDPEEGVEFRAFRLRFRSTLGASQDVSPDQNSMTIEYYKKRGVRQKYEFTLTLDVSAHYAGRSPTEQMKELARISRKAELSPFIYLNDQEPEKHYVNIIQEARVEYTGSNDNRAVAQVSLVEV